MSNSMTEPDLDSARFTPECPERPESPRGSAHESSVLSASDDGSVCYLGVCKHTMQSPLMPGRALKVYATTSPRSPAPRGPAFGSAFAVGSGFLSASNGSNRTNSSPDSSRPKRLPTAVPDAFAAAYDFLDHNPAPAVPLKAVSSS